MERKGMLYEIIIKLTFAIFSFIASVFVVKNIISMLPLFKSFSYDEFELYDVVYKTHIGEIFKDMGIYQQIDGKIILKAVSSFIVNIEWIGIVFLLLSVTLSILYFIFIKWKLIGTYLKMSGVFILCYILKYILFACCILIIFKNSLTSISLALIIGTIVYIIFSLPQIFILILWIIKFIFNIGSDIKYYYSH